MSGSSQGTSLATVVRSDAEKLRASKRQFVDNQMQLDRLRSQCYDVSLDTDFSQLCMSHLFDQHAIQSRDVILT